VAADPIGEDNPIEDILLTGFPNPERKGCPPGDVIEALGNRKIGRDDPAWRHIWGCSPCFREFKIIRDARVARVEQAERQKRTRRNFAAATAAIASAFVGGYFLVSETRSKQSRGVAIVSVDLTEAGIKRGTSDDDSKIFAQLPRKLDEIHLMLPRFSRLGRYVVAILESKLESTAVALGSAVAKLSGGQPTLVVSLDLSDARPGLYFLGTRLEEPDSPATANYYRVQIL
jgi:hypothetical protein